MSTSEIVEDILEHHGIKGMKWGVRRDRSSNVTVSDRGKKIKTSGGVGRSAHPDAVRAREIGQVGKKSGTKALSNQELHAYTSRINMESSFKRAQYSQKNAASRFVATLLGQTGKTQASNLANDVAASQVKKHLARRLVTTAAVAA